MSQHRPECREPDCESQCLASELPAAALCAEYRAEQRTDQCADPRCGRCHPADAAVNTRQPIVSGTIAVYETDGGGYVIVSHTEQYGTNRHVIPAALVRMATGGILGRKLSAVLGGQ